VTNKWAADNAKEVKTNKILVIARTGNEKVREAFEKDMATQLRAKSLDATANYLKHPNLKLEEKMAEERKALVRKM